jgi:hypothetical protein
VTASASGTGRAARLRPDDVLRYLAATGWHRSRDYGRGEIWALQAAPGSHGANGHPYEVLVPLDQRLRDYPLRMSDLLETLAVAEQRDRDSVLGDLDMRWADVLYARLDTMSLAALAPALTGLRDLVLAAARAVDPRHAWEHVRGAEVGAVRTGAPLITVRTMLTAGAGEPGEPMERKVTRTMYEGVLSAYRSATGDQESNAYFPISRIGHAPPSRPSLARETCAALARIGGRSRAGFELRFTWSPDVPFKGDQASFEFTPALLAEVARAARELRDLS